MFHNQWLFLNELLCLSLTHKLWSSSPSLSLLFAKSKSTNYNPQTLPIDSVELHILVSRDVRYDNCSSEKWNFWLSFEFQSYNQLQNVWNSLPKKRVFLRKRIRMWKINNLVSFYPLSPLSKFFVYGLNGIPTFRQHWQGRGEHSMFKVLQL